MTKPPDITAVVVLYNGGDYVEPCLRSLLDAVKKYSIEIIAVDNASSDNSADVAESVDGIKVIRNRRNMGFSTAVNIGSRAGSGHIVVVMNQDTEVHPGTFDVLPEFFNSHTSAAVIGPKVIDSDGEIDPSLSYFPTVFNVTVRIFGLIGYLPERFRFGPHRVPLSEYNSEKKVDWVAGGCFAVRRNVFEELGGLDERYMFYTEETDFCYNAKRMGYEVWYAPGVVVVHYGGTAARKVPIWAMEQSYRSMILFFRKNYRWDRNALIAFFFLVKFLIGIIISFKWTLSGSRREGRDRIAAYRRLIKLILG
ncbi:MAG: glycosyltransferase family 2 protein [Planctomycetota bacterium]|jgi:GT2 family glycosyltransferase